MPVLRNCTIRRSTRLSARAPRNLHEEASYPIEFKKITDSGDSDSSATTADPRKVKRSLQKKKLIIACPPKLQTSSISPFITSYSPSPPLSPSHTAGQAASVRRRVLGHVSRPPNAFMLFRSEFWAKEKLKPEPIERDHRDISRIAAHCWNNLPDHVRAKFQQLAAQKKQEHREEHPDYKYAPVFKRRSPSKSPIKRRPSNKRNLQVENERCRKLASLVMAGVRNPDLDAAGLVKMEEPKHMLQDDDIDGEYEDEELDDQCIHSEPFTQPISSSVSGSEPSSVVTQKRPYAAPIKTEEDTIPADVDYDYLETSEEISEGFVATDDIPPLKLPELSPKAEKANEDYWNFVDPQFGFRSDVSIPEFIQTGYGAHRWYGRSSLMDFQYLNGMFGIPADLFIPTSSELHSASTVASIPDAYDPIADAIREVTRSSPTKSSTSSSPSTISGVTSGRTVTTINTEDAIVAAANAYQLPDSDYFYPALSPTYTGRSLRHIITDPAPTLASGSITTPIATVTSAMTVATAKDGNNSNGPLSAGMQSDRYGDIEMMGEYFQFDG